MFHMSRCLGALCIACLMWLPAGLESGGDGFPWALPGVLQPRCLVKQIQHDASTVAHVQVPGRTFPVEIIHALEDHGQDYLQARLRWQCTCG